MLSPVRAAAAFSAVVHEMGVAGGGADLGMTEDPADHRQALAERERRGRRGCVSGHGRARRPARHAPGCGSSSR